MCLMIEGMSLIYRLGEPWEICAAKPRAAAEGKKELLGKS